MAGGPGIFTGRLSVAGDHLVNGGSCTGREGICRRESRGQRLGDGTLHVDGLSQADLGLSGDNRHFTGRLILNGGTTHADSPRALGSGRVTVEPHATLWMGTPTATLTSAFTEAR